MISRNIEYEAPRTDPTNLQLTNALLARLSRTFQRDVSRRAAIMAPPSAAKPNDNSDYDVSYGSPHLYGSVTGGATRGARPNLRFISNNIEFSGVNTSVMLENRLNSPLFTIINLLSTCGFSFKNNTSVTLPTAIAALPPIPLAPMTGCLINTGSNTNNIRIVSTGAFLPPGGPIFVVNSKRVVTRVLPLVNVADPLNGLPVTTRLGGATVLPAANYWTTQARIFLGYGEDLFLPNKAITEPTPGDSIGFKGQTRGRSAYFPPGRNPDSFGIYRS